MGRVLNGEQFRAALKKIGDIARQLGQPEYPHDPEKLLKALQDVDEGRFAVGGSFPSSAIAIQYGYTVVEDVEPSTFEVKNLEFVPFLEEGDGGSVSGKVMRGRAVILEANFGLVDGMNILKQEKDIPIEMRGQIIVLTGTKLRDSGGDFGVACLVWSGDRGVLRFYWLGYDWRGRGRLVRYKSGT